MEPNIPLAEKYRPRQLKDLVGQEKIMPILEKLLENPRSVILYGPPGVGKTTFARILAKHATRDFYSLNAITASSAEIKSLPKPCILFVDEIQYFNKKQQQTLLPWMESGQIILAGATTESPWHTLNKTLLSRASVLHFEDIGEAAIEKRLTEILSQENIEYDKAALKMLASRSNGDMRLALTTVEMICTADGKITETGVDTFLDRAIHQGFSDDGDAFYSWISALQKSVRGSDPDAAIFYLARLLEAGGLQDTCRRLLVMAAEDIGLASPNILPIAWAAVQSAEKTGMPEARFVLSDLVILMASSPKSSSAGKAYARACKDIEAGKGKKTPRHLARDGAKGYVSPHTVPLEYIDQPYLPEDLIGTTYYVAGNNKNEQAYAAWLKQLKQKGQNSR